MSKSFRAIAFYLPQYYPIPENDKWWSKGFTEWTNVAKARPLFPGHYQPHIPADLGFYDLRVPEARQNQADLARKYGIEGFCYWHYWFGNGKKLLERPLKEVIESGKPDFPFCIGWANHSWSGIWHGAPNRILIEQTYPGKKDFTNHFYYLLSAFKDKRYFKVNDKLVFVIYWPPDLPDAKKFTNLWKDLAKKEGLPGFHFITHGVKNPQDYGCDACVTNAPFIHTPPSVFIKGIRYLNILLNRYIKIKPNLIPIKLKSLPTIRSYKNFVEHLNSMPLSKNEYPLVIPNFDNTPRSNKNGFVLTDSTPALFKTMLQNAMAKIKHIKNPQERIIFIKAWNEWAEGNHIEPDLKFGNAYLKVIKDCIYVKN